MPVKTVCILTPELRLFWKFFKKLGWIFNTGKESWLIIPDIPTDIAAFHMWQTGN